MVISLKNAFFDKNLGFFVKKKLLIREKVANLMKNAYKRVKFLEQGSTKIKDF